ncbi:MAG TPA: RHS repeat-associated core domain-containing protein [Pyrinomonadaceae bacterium]|nr:RHS repeat-associated core domain-containing protein [Pyrinomonadaceae bacterium]
MKSARTVSPRRLLLAALLCALARPGAFAQSSPQTAARPDRGAVSGAAYSVSDIESVNLTSGNVNISIPLASLPPVAGGKLSWTVSATYNSKLWNVTRAQHAYIPNATWQPYTVDTPQLSDLGGWRVGGAYHLSVRNAHEDFDYEIPPPDGSLPYWERQLLLREWYKVVLRTPDGAERELRPEGHAPYSGTQDFLRGYFDLLPSATNPVRYYSFDGTYLTVIVKGVNDWTLFMPDGTQVVQTADGVQRVKDNNGNSIKIFSESGASFTNHYQDEQTGREIKVIHDPAAGGGQGQFRVEYQVAGGAWMSVLVNMGTTTVRGKVYTTGGWDASVGEECQHERALTATGVSVVREIVFPQTEPGQAGRRFTFGYNSDATEQAAYGLYRPSCGAAPETLNTTASAGWGSLSQMTTPLGATVAYSYRLDHDNETPVLSTDSIAEEPITRKQVTHDGTTDTWEYDSIGEAGGGVQNPDGTYSHEESYAHSPGYGYAVGRAGLVYRSTRSGVVVERHWTNLTFAGAATGSPGGEVSFNPVVDAEYTTLTDAQGVALKMSAKTFSHDLNGNVTEVKEYDWFSPSLVARDGERVPAGVPAEATLLRTTVTSYHDSPGTAASSSLVYAKRALARGTPSIIRAVREASVGASITRFSYDGQAYGAAPTKGNVTQVSRLDDKGDAGASNDTWATASRTYDSYGNVLTATDANGNLTEFSYEDATHALPTKTTVDPLNGTGPQITRAAYDYFTGLVTSTTDANNQTTEISYVNQLTGEPDPFARPGVVTAPAVAISGVTQRRKVSTFYEDAARRVRAESDLAAEGDRRLKSRETKDELGRVVLAEHGEGGAAYTISAQTAYVQMGRVVLTSHPKRAGDGSTPEGWERVTRDAAGRVVEVATFQGAARPEPAGVQGTPAFKGAVTTSYWANETTVTDQDGKARKSVADALGRLSKVIEAPGVPGYGFETFYTYDQLGNLRRVEQGGQRRFFLYDSLSRLVRAKHPEQGAFPTDAEFPALSDSYPDGANNGLWSSGYKYDAAGNLIKRRDARGVMTTYTYDGLNRNTTVRYAGETAPNATPAVNRSYDRATLGKGRPWKSEAAGVALTTVNAYDESGRPAQHTQQFWLNNAWGQPFAVARAYDLAGNVASQTYPSGRSVGYTYDAAGRLSSFAGNLGDGVSRAYSDSFIYDAAGRVRQERFGTQAPVYNKRFYNVAGQLSEIRVSTFAADAPGQETNWNRGAIINHYSNQSWAGSGTDNNGNLRKQDIYVPGDEAVTGFWLTTFFYDYDPLNRLARVREVQGGQEKWAQGYAYDRWGNRLVDAAASWDNSQTQWRVPEPQFDAADLPATNRLYAPGDTALPDSQRRMRYDAAGNLTRDAYTGEGARAYDAENRMTSAEFSASQAALYTYDADGRRVKRGAGAGAEVWQVYGFGGELLAEYAAGASPASPQKEHGYRNGELLVTAGPPAPGAGPRTNVALASNGATASSSSSITGYPASSVINGDRRGLNWGSGGGWNDSTADSYPDWVEVTFAGAKIINEVSVFTAQDNIASPLEPTEAMTFTQYGIKSFDVEYWDGSAWATVPDGSVTDNSLVWRRFTFPPLTTPKVRVKVGGALFHHSRVVELEAYEVPGAQLVAVVSSLGVLRNNYTGQVGMKVSVGAQPLTVTSLGRMCASGNAKAHTLKVIKASDNTVAASASVSMSGCAPGQFKYAALASHVTLSANASYYVVSTEVSGGDKWHDYSGTSLTPSTAASITSGAFSGNGTSWTPAGGAGNSYVPVDFKYTTAEADLRWLVADQLGTPRMTLDPTGALDAVTRHDYLPFGEELPAGAAGRVTGQGYGQVDNVRQKFTGYERDVETGLDYAQARYYGNSTGRFTSPDPLLSSANPPSPQSWNRYSYVLNNPLLYVDPTGLEWRINNTPNNDGLCTVSWYGEGDDRTGTTELKPDGSGRITYKISDKYQIELNPNGPAGQIVAYGLNIMRSGTLAGYLLTSEPWGTPREVAQGWKITYTPEYEAEMMSWGAIRERPDIIISAVGLANGVGRGLTARSTSSAVTEDVLVLGRGPMSRLERLAAQEGGRISTTSSTSAREIFRMNYRDIRSSDRIIYYMDNVPRTLEEAIQIGGGQFSRAEVFMIQSRPDLLKKTRFKFEF